MSTSTLSAILAFGVAVAAYCFLAPANTANVPRIGPKPSFLGNTSKSFFSKHSLQLLEEGYAKYRDGLYSLWTTDMDRVIVSPLFMKDFMSLPRSVVRLTASIRHAGPYTGMDIPAYEEIVYALNKKLEGMQSSQGGFKVAVFPQMIELVTCASARVFVGPELCRNPDWLATATGYTLDVAKVTTDLNRYYRIFHPFIAPFLKSRQQIKTRFTLAKKLLAPLIESRRSKANPPSPDMIQWLVDTATGSDATTDNIVRRMLFLNMAAIHTTAEVLTHNIFELCERSETLQMLREEMLEALPENSSVRLTTLNSDLKKTDSFIKESHRLNPLGFMTFNRHLVAPVRLHNGVTLPANTYISINHYSRQRDPDVYPEPLLFDALRFYRLRQQSGESEQHQFASISSTEPWWGVGKFACPGRQWASAQVKLVLMAVLLGFDIGFPEGQSKKPERVVQAEKLRTSFTQQIILKRRER
ncbi:cytochrome P450 [Periconia macrospinosa]|uniref:Cytochrome P450 n=1 Tax=Periconia macrospinosa TaxID=97972 RepID=A0A2V1D8X8_9PLEO|nr:cytochrome P450 [Periconia macrospinosa]